MCRSEKDEAVVRVRRTTAPCPGSSAGTERPPTKRKAAGSSPARGTTFNEVRGADNTAYLHPDVPVRAGRDEAVSLAEV